MTQQLPVIYLARHGETAWTVSGQHTGLTDLPLTSRGERNARSLGDRLKGLTFAKVYTSPLQRVQRTCELAGYGGVAEVDPDLIEWYGPRDALSKASLLPGQLSAGNWDKHSSQMFSTSYTFAVSAGLVRRDDAVRLPTKKGHPRI
jgi:probable phosphoglycerate mutase